MNSIEIDDELIALLKKKLGFTPHGDKICHTCANYHKEEGRCYYKEGLAFVVEAGDTCDQHEMEHDGI
jgi:hypothetical protein